MNFLIKKTNKKRVKKTIPSLPSHFFDRLKRQTRGSYFLFCFQVLAHISIVPMLLFGVWQDYLISLFVYFLTGCLGMTMTYHRLLSHRNWKVSKYIEYLFVIFATVGLIGSAISWVAIHRKHHKYTDEPDDPHSPYHKGWFYCHFLSMFEKVEVKYVTELITNPFYKFQHRYYYFINILWAISMVFVWKDAFAIIYAWLFPSALLWNAVSSLVSISHRNKKIQTDLILSFLVFGEGYHKEHHKNPKNYRFGRYDIGGLLIKSYKKFF